MTPSVVQDVGMSPQKVHEMLYCFSASENRLNLRQRNREHPRAQEPGEEQHIFLCNRKGWWGAELTHVSPGFPTFLLKFGTLDWRGRFHFFQALKCWAEFFFTRLRINLMTPESGCQHVPTSTRERNQFCVGLFSPNRRSWWMPPSPRIMREAGRRKESSKVVRVAMNCWQLIHTKEKPVPGRAKPHVGFPGTRWRHGARKLKTAKCQVIENGRIVNTTGHLNFVKYKKAN